MSLIDLSDYRDIRTKQVLLYSFPTLYNFTKYTIVCRGPMGFSIKSPQEQQQVCTPGRRVVKGGGGKPPVQKVMGYKYASPTPQIEGGNTLFVPSINIVKIS